MRNANIMRGCKSIIACDGDSFREELDSARFHAGERDWAFLRG